MMSKHSSKSKIPSTKVVDWVEPDFSDFTKNTNPSSSIFHKKSSTDTNHCQKRKEDSPPLDSCKHGRKRRKAPPTDKQYYLSKGDGEHDAPWVDKYKPKTLSELAIHKKKIEELETWLKEHVFQRKSRQGGSVLLLTGPPGCGKSTAVDVIAKNLDIQVHEWINPILQDFKKDDLKDILGHESDFQILPYQSQATLFQEFLLRANKYTQLQMVGEPLETDKRLILVEDMPNHFYRDPSSLHEILRRFMRTGRCPLVFILSDSFSRSSSQRSLFPKEVQEELRLTNISFNPVAPTIMMKVLNRIISTEINTRREKTDIHDKASLELICKGCSGDIRSAINSLQFSSLKEYSSGNNSRSHKKGNLMLKCDTLSKVKKKELDNRSEEQKIQAFGGKDASIFLFHALGKILYCKRKPTPELACPRLPSHLSEYERNPLLVQPEDVIEKSHMTGDIFNLYLHQNYIDFFSDIDELVRASEYISIADFPCSNWDARSILQEYSASVATRGVMHSNKARALAQNQGGMGFHPLHKPQWFLISKKYHENCAAAKFLFSSFCSTPVCLQTQLLPYLAMLTNPMRNQAQITFIQDVGRLPVKKHFGRLQLETLTDNDSAVQGLESNDEGSSNQGHSTNMFTQPEENHIAGNGSDECFFPSSQSSGNELLSSQPRPSIAQRIMEEEELNIDEYDSD